MHSVSLTTLGIGIVSFISTNVDNLILILFLFSSGKFSQKTIILAQFLATFLVLAASGIVAAFGSFVIPQNWAHLLGIIPLGLGVFAYFSRRVSHRSNDPNTHLANQWVNASSRKSNIQKILTLAGLTFSIGVDNVAVYSSIFTNSNLEGIIVLILTYFVMTGAWALLGRYLARLGIFEQGIRIWFERVYPFLFIALGIYILLKPFIS